MDIINMVLGAINSPWAWLIFPLLLGWLWIPKTAADDVDCSHINDLQTKKVDTDWKDYKARAYLNPTQDDIAHGVFTKVQLNNESYDPGGNFDHTVNYRFVAPIKGYYLILAQAMFDAADMVAEKYFQALIKKNNTTYIISSAEQSVTINDYPTCPLIGVHELLADDYIELFVQHSAGPDDLDVYGNALGTATWMDVHILST